MGKENKLNFIGREIWDMINRLVDYKMQSITQIQSAVVQFVNEDNTVDIIIPPSTTVYHHIQNQSIYELKIGDNVKIIKENNNLSNIWVIGGFNLTILKGHPIGSYFTSDDPTNPSQLFGGKWEQIKDKMILAYGDLFNDYTYPIDISFAKFININSTEVIANEITENQTINLKIENLNPIELINTTIIKFVIGNNNKYLILKDQNAYWCIYNSNDDQYETDILSDNSTIELNSKTYGGYDVIILDNNYKGIIPSTSSMSGEISHLLKTREIPAHNHQSVDINNSNNADGFVAATINDYGTGTSPLRGPSSSGLGSSPAEWVQYVWRTGNTGSSQPHNNMPPYICAYIWKRIA